MLTVSERMNVKCRWMTAVGLSQRLRHNTFRN
jgi:hypothetical protein